MLSFVLMTVLFWCVLASPAYAWGAGMHYHLAQQLLELGLLGGTLGTAIKAYRNQFLFGNIIADIVVGKNMIEVENHSHHWSVARRLRDMASGDAQKAFAGGYWTHLAADTVAHNIFLSEERTPSALSTPNMRHVYLELQADAWVPRSVSDDLALLLEEDFQEERMLLEEAVPRTVFPYKMNWFLMNNALKFTGRGTTRRIANVFDRFHPYDLPADRMEYYFELSLSRMEESMEGDNNRITRLNPISKGTRFLTQ